MSPAIRVIRDRPTQIATSDRTPATAIATSGGGGVDPLKRRTAVPARTAAIESTSVVSGRDRLSSGVAVMCLSRRVADSALLRYLLEERTETIDQRSFLFRSVM